MRIHFQWIVFLQFLFWEFALHLLFLHFSSFFFYSIYEFARLRHQGLKRRTKKTLKYKRTKKNNYNVVLLNLQKFIQIHFSCMWWCVCILLFLYIATHKRWIQHRTKENEEWEKITEEKWIKICGSGSARFLILILLVVVVLILMVLNSDVLCEYISFISNWRTVTR